MLEMHVCLASASMIDPDAIWKAGIQSKVYRTDAWWANSIGFHNIWEGKLVLLFCGCIVRWHRKVRYVLDIYYRFLLGSIRKYLQFRSLLKIFVKSRRSPCLYFVRVRKKVRYLKVFDTRIRRNCVNMWDVWYQRVEKTFFSQHILGLVENFNPRWK